jgi:hypothetical protein
MTTRLVADLCFPSMCDVLDAVVELKEEGCTTMISHEIIDVCSSAVFAEAWKDIADDGKSGADGAMLNQVQALIDRYDGFCDSVASVSPPHLHVPFKTYMEEQ